ncbi:hypothetical protein Y71_16505 [Kosakonia radicincitans DSM 16656]|jgi:hypothetical protein|uniref:hypothetical protein n=1 Tax=Enterobacteriaceae TaxID=543 RepID=UPI000272EE7C|nr:MULTISPECIES: hypothetical protein [Enterobacteriaceae]MCL5502133.1 hypothetical protein [Escherichia coli]MDU4242665.1 hypothetical protein [Bifidobacterium longum]MDU6686564.1 hypothetical protein [Enterobacteriaceae bacterium]ARD61448.1 hypothetical protein Y71_16505 [Kosakonia radicincitans DSM 16656]MDU7134810.1 hypothetical protein [Enterobacteriaceae bacterium]
MQENVAEGMAAVASHPVTVQVFMQGPGIWGNVATAIITAGAAIAAVMLTHRFTLRREKRASDEKLKREQHFIATELVFLLENFAESCSDVATDAGENNDDPEPTREPTVGYPDLSFTNVSGDWQVLDARLMYRIRELIVLQQEAHKAIAFVADADCFGQRYEYFRERQYQYARLGLKAIIQVRRLRRVAEFPETRLAISEWSAQRVMWDVWRKARRRRAKEAAEERKMLDDLNYPENLDL